MDTWNPDQYSRFAHERARPFWDLAAKVDFTKTKSLLDLGCGSGELTAQLHGVRGLKHTLGIDSSQAMLAKAVKYKAEGLQYSMGDIEAYVPRERFDVVFSNAALQWTDEHKALFPKLLGWLEAGGQFAVQMPCNFDHASHFLASDLANEMKLRPRKIPLLAPETYAELLHRHGMTDIDVTIKVYLHSMNSGKDVVEWTKGSLLTYFEQQLDPPTYRKFLAEYARRLALVTGEGPYLYPFKRLFIYGKKP